MILTQTRIAVLFSSSCTVSGAWSVSRLWWYAIRPQMTLYAMCFISLERSCSWKLLIGGSSKAAWGQILQKLANLAKPKSPNLLRALEPSSEILVSLQQDFHKMLARRDSQGERLQMFCFNEEVPYSRVGKVLRMYSTARFR